jgi:hypothetical protein
VVYKGQLESKKEKKGEEKEKKERKKGRKREKGSLTYCYIPSGAATGRAGLERQVDGRCYHLSSITHVRVAAA